jgi:prepilin-type N-terminal cleavage/methylation domain-containing protein
MHKQKGFSLIELLIVVAIILIIAAIAVPNLLRSRMAANEASAVGSTRTIVSSEFAYYSTFGGGTTYATLATLGTNNLVDTVLAAGSKSGYSTMAALAGTPNGTQFITNSIPLTVGTTGQRAFCSTEDGVIHFDPNGAGTTAHDTCQGMTNVLQ